MIWHDARFGMMPDLAQCLICKHVLAWCQQNEASISPNKYKVVLLIARRPACSDSKHELNTHTLQNFCMHIHKNTNLQGELHIQHACMHPRSDRQASGMQ